MSPAEANAGKNVTICIGESTILTANGGAEYLWSTGDTNRTIEVRPTRTTTYKLTATRGGAVDYDVVIVTVENCRGNNVSDSFINDFEVFPNPTTGILNINVNNLTNDLNLVIIGFNGSVIHSEKVKANNGDLFKQLDLSRFAKGVYFVRLFNSNQNMVKKIMVI